jgi:hypothetical protein
VITIYSNRGTLQVASNLASNSQLVRSQPQKEDIPGLNLPLTFLNSHINMIDWGFQVDGPSPMV